MHLCSTGGDSAVFALMIEMDHLTNCASSVSFPIGSNPFHNLRGATGSSGVWAQNMLCLILVSRLHLSLKMISMPFIFHMPEVDNIIVMHCHFIRVAKHCGLKPTYLNPLTWYHKFGLPHHTRQLTLVTLHWCTQMMHPKANQPLSSPVCVLYNLWSQTDIHLNSATVEG